MPDVPAFDEYLTSLGRLSAHVDPTAASPEAANIKAAAASLAAVDDVSVASLAAWVTEHPAWVDVLGLSVGLSQEKLKNTLKDWFGTSGWITLARQRPVELIERLDTDLDLVRLVTVQRHRTYDFGDVLIARAGTRGTAKRAGRSGRKIEDEIEAIAMDLGLPCRTRTKFVGRNGRTAPCDLVIPESADAHIAVAAKGFDSTGSKLTDAVREIEEMAEVRMPRQFIMAVIDGIGWKSRQSDLRRIHALWANGSIDGMYTLSSLDRFRHDLRQAALLRGLTPTSP
ncbi:hypothetical protein [Jiangella asiatica]|uniref:Restriction endonuclease type II DpnII-like domain-containing protein n=1 Tax=Jiangella asiatica TaxID=2530372 RepID=A0A4V2YZS4_9ACTN|nr:hypothetical protein E1269_28975 [Jiangella asiatica]